MDETQKLLREMHGTIMVLEERSRSILAQTERTNGRVSKLETEHDQLASKVGGLEGDQKAAAVKIGGVLSVIGVVVSVVISKLFN